jgi:hypothetical protein
VFQIQKMFNLYIKFLENGGNWGQMFKTRKLTLWSCFLQDNKIHLVINLVLCRYVIALFKIKIDFNWSRSQIGDEIDLFLIVL